MAAENGYLFEKCKTVATSSPTETITDHPKFIAILTHLNYQYSLYKYTVYRCASKISTLQKLFYSSHIPFKLVLQIFENHHLNQADDNLYLRKPQLTTIIRDIYFACEKLGLFSESASYNFETATAVIMNFFWNVFDPNNKGRITLLELKESFLFLCDVNCVEQMISAYFLLIADHNRCISKYRFECMMKVLTKILTFIEESDSYGSQNIPDIIDQCYASCPGINGINEYQFHCLWTTTQTRFLIYANLLALVKRIKDTENLVHNIPCASCHIQQIIGIRFKCQICKNLSLCMKCFSIGYSNNKHESGGHRMYEVFTDDVPERKWTHYLAKLCNMLFISNTTSDEDKELTSSDDICGTYNTICENNTEIVTIDTKLSDSIKEIQKCENSFESTYSRNIPEKLLNIVDKLNNENKIINEYKSCLNESKQKNLYEFLNNHEQILNEIVDQLKLVTDNSKCDSFPTSSTPNRASIDARPRLNSSQLSRSINGAEINKSYLEANKSDYSISDLSVWYSQKRNSAQLLPSQNIQILTTVKENNEDECITETDMKSFRDLLNKVKEIVDDSYSDNSELAYATQNLENVLDGIIRNEENIRSSAIK